MSPTPRHPWLILGVVLFGSVAAVIAQFAAPPLMPLLMEAFGIDLAQASTLMSVFSVTGLVLALPAGVILGRFGPVVTGVVALGSVVAGSAMGAVAPDYTILLFSRLVQGVGMGLIGVTAPAIVAATFAPERRGTPMGIWATWVPLGGLIMYNVAPVLAATGGWQAAWWFAGAVALVAGVLWVVVLAAWLPPRPAPGAGPGPIPLRTALAGRDIWLLAAAFGMFAVAMGGFNTFLPTFLASEGGYELAAASRTSSVVLLGSLLGSLGSGLLSDRIGSRRRVYTGAALVLAVLWVLPYIVDPAFVPVLLLAIGLGSGALPAAIFASAPEAMRDRRAAGAGMAALMVGQNGGMVVGPVMFGALVTATTWSTAGLVLGVVSVAGAVVGWRARIR
ncbi:MAG TPA: MFS transporter [Candidatus Limnocylindrales bacterium]|nr:MFS transporter [Candidatus Limnocylindrales bacterium]